MRPYETLARKRRGETLSSDEIAEVVRGAVDGSWQEAELGAFLMATAIKGLDATESRALTREMVASGEAWALGAEIPHLCDKHSTGGVGDKVSLVLGPLLAALDLPTVMLTGRALGHTGGTADKLESIPGVSLSVDRDRCLEQLATAGVCFGLPTDRVAPADGILYGLRDRTATVDSLPLIVASILSKKLATGASAIVFDVKCGSGAVFPRLEDARALARSLVSVATEVRLPALARVTDMSQPLGRWVGHRAEVRESWETLSGEGPADLVELVLTLAADLAELQGRSIGREQMRAALADGRALERFRKWAELAGAPDGWLGRPDFSLAPVEVPIRAGRSGRIAAVDTRRLGLLMVEAGSRSSSRVALEYRTRLGAEVERGDELARLYLEQELEAVVEGTRSCFSVEPDAPPGPALLRERWTA